MSPKMKSPSTNPKVPCGKRKCNLRKCLLVMILTLIRNQKQSPLKGMRERRKSGFRLHLKREKTQKQSKMETWKRGLFRMKI
uniref:Uncharacterized protein n=1 Tax=Salix viminalis TaxID=40686 RepID=A0A6N2MBA9_SALVM